jgi:DNA-binding protein YbaB
MGFGVPELDRQLDQLVENMGKVEELQGKLAEVVGTGEAADGRVRVSSDNTGRITQVEIDPRAMRLPSDDLAAAITEAAQLAFDDISKQASDLMTEMMPNAASFDSLRRTNTQGLGEESRAVIDAVSKSADPARELRAQFDRMRSRM